MKPPVKRDIVSKELGSEMFAPGTVGPSQRVQGSLRSCSFFYVNDYYLHGSSLQISYLFIFIILLTYIVITLLDPQII